MAMAHGAPAGLRLLKELEHDGSLDEYHLLHAARADLLRRDSRRQGATQAYTRALDLAGNEAERQFLSKRLREVRGVGS